MSDEQPGLFDDLGTPDAPSNPLEAKFWKFHAENPQVYVLFDGFTQQAIKRGHQSLSADMVMHRIRWETSIETTETEVVNGKRLKIANAHVAYYSRFWMRNNPIHDGFFRLCKLKNGEVSDQLDDSE